MSPLDAKHGSLEMTFTSRGPGAPSILSHLYRKVPMIVQQALYFDEELPQMPCVYILSSGGPILEGDHYSVAVTLEPSAMAHISTGAASIIASMQQGEASQNQLIRLHRGSYLEWLPQPIIPGRGATYHAATRIVVEPGASLFWSEVVCCGRLHHGERFAYRELDMALTVERPDGTPLFRERVLLEPSVRSPDEWALLGGFDHFATILILADQEDSRALYTLFRAIPRGRMRMSLALLSEGCGLAIRLLANDTQLLLEAARELCSAVRQRVKGCPLQSEFPWRQGGITQKHTAL